jgi:hypothetical protein
MIPNTVQIHEKAKSRGLSGNRQTENQVGRKQPQLKAGSNLLRGFLSDLLNHWLEVLSFIWIAGRPLHRWLGFSYFNGIFWGPAKKQRCHRGLS